METRQSDTSNTNGTINETTKHNYPLITHEQIPGTPFTITGNQDKGYFLRLGDYRITEAYQTKQDAADQLTIEQWNIIVKVLSIVMEKILSKNTEQIKEK